MIFVYALCIHLNVLSFFRFILNLVYRIVLPLKLIGVRFISFLFYLNFDHLQDLVLHSL